MTRPSILLANASQAEIEAWLERENARTLAAQAATQEDHERLVQRLGELVIESRKEQWTAMKGGSCNSKLSASPTDASKI